MTDESLSAPKPHSISVVIPVFRAELTLRSVVEELIDLELTLRSNNPSIWLREIILVHDCGPDRSDEVMRQLAREHRIVKNVWLARNSGQHAATLAGMASSNGEWVVTMDEDGQHDPNAIRGLLETALIKKADLVYARSVNGAPHGFLRNVASSITKKVILPALTGGRVHYFSSFRLVLGEASRSIAAFASNDVYLDVALSWVTRSSTTHDVKMRVERRDSSGYSKRTLMSHLVRLVLSAGTRPLRIASVIGGGSFATGLAVAIAVAVRKVMYGFNVVGWASMFGLLLIIGGLILLVLGIVAEYVGLLVRTAIGRPLYVISNDRATGPLYRENIERQ